MGDGVNISKDLNWEDIRYIIILNIDRGKGLTTGHNKCIPFLARTITDFLLNVTYKDIEAYGELFNYKKNIYIKKKYKEIVVFLYSEELCGSRH